MVSVLNEFPIHGPKSTILKACLYILGIIPGGLGAYLGCKIIKLSGVKFVGAIIGFFLGLSAPALVVLCVLCVPYVALKKLFAYINKRRTRFETVELVELSPATRINPELTIFHQKNQPKRSFFSMKNFSRGKPPSERQPLLPKNNNRFFKLHDSVRGLYSNLVGFFAKREETSISSGCGYGSSDVLGPFINNR